MAVHISFTAHSLKFEGNTWELPKDMMKVVDNVIYFHVKSTCQPLIRLIMGKDKIPKNSSMAACQTIKDLKIERNTLCGRLPLDEQDDNAVVELFAQDGVRPKRRKLKYNDKIDPDKQCEVHGIKMLSPQTNLSDLYVHMCEDNLTRLFEMLKDEGDDLISNKKMYNRNGEFAGIHALRKNRVKTESASEARSSNE